jgi:hypothetical protein
VDGGVVTNMIIGQTRNCKVFTKGQIAKLGLMDTGIRTGPGKIEMFYVSEDRWYKLAKRNYKGTKYNVLDEGHRDYHEHEILDLV